MTLCGFRKSYNVIQIHDKERMLVDGSRGRVSVKEKLAKMRAGLGKDKVDVQKTLEKSNIAKIKIKEESL